MWDLLAARRAKALGVGLLSGGYGQDELERAGAYRVYLDPADLMRHLDEVGLRGITRRVSSGERGGAHLNSEHFRNSGVRPPSPQNSQFQFPNGFFENDEIGCRCGQTSILRFFKYCKRFCENRSPRRVFQTEDPLPPGLSGRSPGVAAFCQSGCSVEEFFHDVLVNHGAAAAKAPDFELSLQRLTILDQ